MTVLFGMSVEDYGGRTLVSNDKFLFEYNEILDLFVCAQVGGDEGFS